MATNFALHIAAAWLVLYLAGPVAAAIFAVHPMAADAIATVKGRSALLLAIGVLLAIIIYRHSHIAAVCVTLIAGFSAIGFSPSYMATIHEAPGRWQYVKQLGYEFWFSVIPKMFVPIGLTGEPMVAYRPILAILGIVGILAALILLWLWPACRLGIGLILIPLLPYFMVPLPNGFYEHRAYLSLAGASILIAIFLRRMPRGALLIVPAFLVMAEARAHAYASPVSLWEDAVRQDPSSGRALVNLGSYYARSERWYEAQGRFEDAIRIAPEIRMGWKNLAFVHLLHGDVGGASQILDAELQYRHSISN